MSKKFIIILILGFILGVGAGYFWGVSAGHDVLDKSLNVIRPIRENNPNYKFINPLLAYILPPAVQDQSLVSLKKRVADVITEAKDSGRISDASMFFYEVNKGRWTGVDEDRQYPPASMFKVVIMVAYFKGSEQIPALLDQKLIYTKDINDKTKNVAMNSGTELQIGASYKINNLIEKMIIDSDNGAELLLLDRMDRKFFGELFDVLGIKDFSPDGSFFISPRQYSLFLRILYNATFLNVDLSEKALELLSMTTFKGGLVSGVPENVIVSHKFGQYVDYENGELKEIELHDCGIIYYPQNPYLLCVMTKGENLDNLKSIIKEISSLAYQNYFTFQ